MQIHFGIPFTPYIFQFVISKTNPIWVRLYYKYKVDDAVIGLSGEIEGKNTQALGIDFDDELEYKELIYHVSEFKTFIKHNWGIDLGRAWVFETSPKKYYVWFLDSRLEYRCSCPTIINMTAVEGLKADDNYIMWLQKKNACVMRATPKKFYTTKPKLMIVLGNKPKELPKDQEAWQEEFLKVFQ